MTVLLALMAPLACGGAGASDPRASSEAADGAVTPDAASAAPDGGSVDGGSAVDGEAGADGAVAADGATTSPTGVPASFFGMHFSSAKLASWPGVRFSTLRTWDQWPGVAWTNLNPSKGSYDWANLDAVIDAATAKGVEVIYTFGYVPNWASSNPAGACDGLPAGSCYAPVMSDWEAFVTALANRYQGKIAYYELWNEPSETNFWQGTTAEMVSMAQVAYPILKKVGATVLSPAPQGTNAYKWMSDYLNAGGAPYLDVVTFHGYVADAPEAITTLAANMKSVMSAHGLSAKPLWDTEHSWGIETWPYGATQDLQAAWLARFQVLSYVSGIERSAWYLWDAAEGEPQWGTLFDKTSRTLLVPGIAYREVYAWMLGATIEPCAQSGTLYRCHVTRPGGYEGDLVWNAVDTSSTADFMVPAGYTQARAIDGTTSAVQGGATLPVGMKPLLVEKPL